MLGVGLGAIGTILLVYWIRCVGRLGEQRYRVFPNSVYNGIEGNASHGAMLSERPAYLMRAFL
ncbi:hypothetical protein HDG33_007518 [Paraburkholderia sp. Cpub6]|nr:hypothetical protein [Paraburkholderia sp. Cpub6]